MPSLLSQFLPRVSSIWELNSRAEAGGDFGGRANDGVAGRGGAGGWRVGAACGGTAGFEGGGGTEGRSAGGSAG